MRPTRSKSTLTRLVATVAISIPLLAGCAANRTLLGVCPEYPYPPESTLQTLEEAARRDKPTEEWVIDQSQLADQLDACRRGVSAADLVQRQ